MANDNSKNLNENLKNALKRTGLTAEEFADIVEVDVKTVQRWIAGRTPTPRHRAKVAAALDTTEHALWPEPEPTASPPPPPVREPGTRSGITDVIAGYGHATDPGAPQPAMLLEDASERIEIVIPALTQLRNLRGMIELLIAKSIEGARIRLLIEDPDPQLEPLLGHERIEIHASPAGEDYGLYRSDHQLLLVLRRIGVLSDPPPLIHLQRTSTGGLFDRVARHFDGSWRLTTPLRTREELDEYLIDTDLEDDELETEPGDEVDRDNARGVPTPPLKQTISEPAPGSARRWPGRPA
jgi:transcriptional regulator with XRE-family HTH domain